MAHEPQNQILTPLDSTNLEKVRYNIKAEKLRVYFKNGSIYDYHSVPKVIYDGLVSADSAGSYFHKNIRSNSDIKATKITHANN